MDDNRGGHGGRGRAVVRPPGIIEVVGVQYGREGYSRGQLGGDRGGPARRVPEGLAAGQGVRAEADEGPLAQRGRQGALGQYLRRRGRHYALKLCGGVY